MNAPQGLKINRIAKGKRPKFYLDEPAAERLLATVSALITELTVQHKRVDNVKRIADKKDVVLTAEFENFAPDAKALEERERWRQAYMAYMDRVLAIVDQEFAHA